jgi:hypothetical protein
MKSELKLSYIPSTKNVEAVIEGEGMSTHCKSVELMESRLSQWWCV